MGYTFSPERGVVEDAGNEAVPSTLRALYDGSVSLYDAGFRSGMGDARRSGDRTTYTAHLRMAQGLYGQPATSRAFSDGYVAGFTAITSRVMQ